MGLPRFLVENFIESADMLAISSTAAGVISNVQKEASGAALLVAEGTPTNTVDLDYYIRIDSVSAGTEVGQATLQWSDDDGATFDGSGIVTPSVAYSLNNGITIYFVSGTGADFALNDVNRFKVFLPYGKAKLIDRKRSTDWRSSTVGTTPITLTADFGAGLSKKIEAVVLCDHNISERHQGLRFQASDAADFSVLLVDEALPWRTTHILYYVVAPQLARYARIRVIDEGNVDTYVRMSGLYMGRYVELTQSYALGDQEGHIRFGQVEQQPSGEVFGGLNATGRGYDFSYTYVNATDRDRLIAIWDALNDLTNSRMLPVLFNPDSAVPSKIGLYHWNSLQAVASSIPDAPGRYTVPFRLTEVPRTLRG